MLSTRRHIFSMKDDPVPYPEARKLYWYVGLERDTTTWMALCIYYPDDWKKGMELANEIHGRGQPLRPTCKTKDTLAMMQLTLAHRVAP